MAADCDTTCADFYAEVFRNRFFGESIFMFFLLKRENTKENLQSNDKKPFPSNNVAASTTTDPQMASFPFLFCGGTGAEYWGTMIRGLRSPVNGAGNGKHPGEMAELAITA